MGQFSAVELIGRIGDAVIEYFRSGAIECFVDPDHPSKLRLFIRFAEGGDHQDDLARLSNIAKTAGAEIERRWVDGNVIALEMLVQPCSSRFDRVVPAHSWT
jgi:hypothetical protein